MIKASGDGRAKICLSKNAANDILQKPLGLAVTCFFSRKSDGLHLFKFGPMQTEKTNVQIIYKLSKVLDMFSDRVKGKLYRIKIYCQGSFFGAVFRSKPRKTKVGNGFHLL